jgi:hypothetical protein
LQKSYHPARSEPRAGAGIAARFLIGPRAVSQLV